MDETDSLGIGPEKAKRLKVAVEGSCELCGSYTPLPFLEVHLISRRRTNAEKRDPSLRIIVACPACHDKLHAIPVTRKAQRAVTARRDFFIRRDLRDVLGYEPSPYQPPDDQDLSEIYEGYRNAPQRLSG